MKTYETVLRAGLTCARKHGLYKMTRSQVAKIAGISPAAVSFHFEDMIGLRREVVKASIARVQFLDVLAQALTAKDYHAVRAPAEVKRLALDTAA